MPKPSAQIQQKIFTATLKLATLKPWPSLTLKDIAKTAQIPLGKITAYFSSTNEILSAIIGDIDNKVEKQIGRSNQSDTPHDRLFEIIMCRFDILQPHKAAILRIIESAKLNPSLARTLLDAQWQTMGRMLSIAGLVDDENDQLLVKAGLLSIYGLTLCKWKQDTSRDMAQTMAALDRYIGYADKLSVILLRNK